MELIIYGHVEIEDISHFRRRNRFQIKILNFIQLSKL